MAGCTRILLFGLPCYSPDAMKRTEFKTPPIWTPIVEIWERLKAVEVTLVEDEGIKFVEITHEDESDEYYHQTIRVSMASLKDLGQALIEIAEFQEEYPRK